MAKTKTNFDAAMEKLTADTAAGTRAFSRGKLVDMTRSYLNDPAYTSEIYTAKGDTYEVTESTPVANLRGEIKKFVKTNTGLDDAELAKLDTAEVSKSFASATATAAVDIVKNYISTGKRLTLPVNAPDEGVMTIEMVDVEEKTAATKKITETAPGKYESVPTGKVVTRKAHKAARATTKLPGWLKITEDQK